MEDIKKITIEDLAWQMYQTGMKIRWETKITPREEFSKHENYNDYIKAVEECLNRGYIPKFETSITYKLPSDTKTYPVIKVPASGKPVWYGGARAMLFVYSKDHGNFILEGYSHEVDEYLHKNYTHYFYRYTYWCNGKSRGGWKFWKDTVGIIEPSESRKEWKYTIRRWTGGRHNVSVEESNKTCLKLKRLPKRWIPEFNKL